MMWWESVSKETANKTKTGSVRRGLPVYPFLQFFTNLEEGEFLGADLNLLPGLGISAGIGVVSFDHKTAETTDFNAIATL